MKVLLKGFQMTHDFHEFFYIHRHKWPFKSASFFQSYGKTSLLQIFLFYEKSARKNSSAAAQCSILQFFVPPCCLLTEYSLILLFQFFFCCRLADVKLNLSTRAFVRPHVCSLMMLQLANVKTNIMYYLTKNKSRTLF